MKQTQQLQASELQSLRNALESFNLIGYEVREDQTRKRKYFLMDDKGTSLTGYWDYIRLNHYIMGYGRAKNRAATNNKTDSKEVLHTQDLPFGKLEVWEDSFKGEYFYSIKAYMNEGEYRTILRTPEAFRVDEINIHAICKAVNNYQKLLDSNRELLEALEFAKRIIDSVNENIDTAKFAGMRKIETAINNAKNIK